jgi:hypothetical protein
MMNDIVLEFGTSRLVAYDLPGSPHCRFLTSEVDRAGASRLAVNDWWLCFGDIGRLCRALSGCGS